MDLLSLWRRLSRRPGGRWLFTRLVCLKAPYFASIAPRLLQLEPGKGVASLRQRRRVNNHLGGVHAIALCNLAEFVGGLTCEVSVPRAMRWIPQGMRVEYLKKATGTLVATAQPLVALAEAGSGYLAPFQVQVEDGAGALVFRAEIAMWVSPRPAAGP